MEIKTCSNPLVMLAGGTLIEFSEWVKKGPAPRHFYPAETLYCEEDNELRIIGNMPIQYRNNELSHFLIAMQVFSDPWERTPETIEGFPKAFNIKNSPAINLIMEKNSQTKFSWLGTDFFSDINLIVTPNYMAHICQIYYDSYAYITTNAPNKHPIDYPLISDFTWCIHSQASTTSSLDRYISPFVPDSTFAENTKLIHVEIQGYPTRIITAISHSYQISFVAIFMAIPGRITLSNIWSVVRLFGIGSTQNLEQLTRESIEILKNISLDTITKMQ